jgi:hypothetical protein
MNFTSPEVDKSQSSDRFKSGSNDMAFGIRDALLVKCKDTIESLNVELHEEKHAKKLLESRIKDLEQNLSIAQHKLAQQENYIEDLKAEIEENEVLAEEYKEEVKRMQAMKPIHEAQMHMQSTVKSLEHSLSTLQEENAKLKQQLNAEKARQKENSESREKKSTGKERISLENIENELEELYEKKHQSLIKEFEKKQEYLKDDLENAISDIEKERERYEEMYKIQVNENNSLRQEIKYLENMLQRKQSQLEKHSQQSLEQLQQILENKKHEETEAYESLIYGLEKEKNDIELAKIDLENELFFVKQRLTTENSAETIKSLKEEVAELQEHLKEEIKEKQDMRKSLDDLKKCLNEPISESIPDSRQVELVKLKYQTMLQAEMQKRLKDKQNYKENLIRDKEAFISKLKSKDERIQALEAQNSSLLHQISEKGSEFLSKPVSTPIRIDSSLISPDSRFPKYY